MKKLIVVVFTLIATFYTDYSLAQFQREKPGSLKAATFNARKDNVIKEAGKNLDYRQKMINGLAYAGGKGIDYDIYCAIAVDEDWGADLVSLKPMELQNHEDTSIVSVPFGSLRRQVENMYGRALDLEHGSVLALFVRSNYNSVSTGLRSLPITTQMIVDISDDETTECDSSFLRKLTNKLGL